MIAQTHLLPILLPNFNPPKGSKPEARLCMEIASYLREETLCKDFPYVWFHVPNQFAGLYKGRFGAELSHMGRINGIPDYAFLGKDGSFFVEVKSENGIQSESQKIVQKWCEDKGVSYCLSRSLDDVKQILKERSND